MKLELTQIVKEDWEEVRKLISTSFQVSNMNNKRLKPIPYTLYEAVEDILSDDTRLSLDQVKYLSAYEQALSVFRAASLKIRESMDIMTLEQKITVTGDQTLDSQIKEGIFFSNRYALAFAGYVGLALLDSKKADVKSNFTFGKYDVSKDRDMLTGELAKVATQDLIRVTSELDEVNDDSLRYVLESIFTSWINQFSWNTHEATLKAIGLDEGIDLQYKNYSIRSGEFRERSDIVKVDQKFMQVHKSDIIGSEDFVSTIWSNLVMLSAYDHERRENPFDPASVIFTYGEPGGGKTFISHATIRSFSDLCREKGISVWAFTHSMTDYASHYQNLTANRLNELATEINEFPGIVIMYVADADKIFLSRKDDRLSAEQRQTLGVYLSMFDGTLIPKNGKFMSVLDANYIEGIDDATKSRLFDEIVELERWTNAEYFEELARRSLTKGLDHLDISDQEWDEIGNYILNTPLSNREVGHVLRKLRRGYTIPEEMIGKSWDEQVAYRNEQLTAITKDRTIGQFDTYINTRMEIERASLLSLHEQDMNRFLTYLNERPKLDKNG